MSWSEQPDAVLLEQGRASAVTGHALATAVVPNLGDLAARLAVPGARVLDVGTGVAGLAAGLARALPAVEVTGTDVSARALRLARDELARLGPVAGRVSLRLQDVATLDDHHVFDLAWVPAPFLDEPTLTAALPRVRDALTVGGWIVVGTDPPAGGTASRDGAGEPVAHRGDTTVDARAVADRLGELGFADVGIRPTFPGGPVLVVGRTGAAA